MAGKSKATKKSLTMNGLSSESSYFVLYRENTLGLHVAISPIMTRVSDTHIMIGGKVRVGFDAAYGVTPKRKIAEPINEAAADKTLADFFQGCSWGAVGGGQRVSKVVGMHLAAGVFDGVELKTMIGDKKLDIAGTLIHKLQEHFGKFTTDWKVQNPGLVKTMLNAKYKEGLGSDGIFKSVTEVGKVTVGVCSELGDFSSPNTAKEFFKLLEAVQKGKKKPTAKIQPVKNDPVTKKEKELETSADQEVSGQVELPKASHLGVVDDNGEIKDPE